MALAPEQLKNAPCRKADSPLRLPERVCDVFLALMATAFLLYFDANGYTAITAAKRNALYVLSGGFFAAIAFALVFVLRRSEGRAALKQRIKACSVVFWALSVYLLLTLISTLASPHPQAVWLGASRNEGFVTHAIYVLIFALLALFARPKPWLLYVFGCSLLLLFAVSLAQLLGANPFRLYPKGYSFFNTDPHFLGTVGNVGFLGGLLCVAIPVLAVAVLRGTSRWRFLLLLPLICCLVLTVCISVLAAYVGLFVGGLIALPFVLRFSRRWTKRYYAALAVAAAAALVILWLADIGSGLSHELHELLHGHFDDHFGTGRLYIWRQVLSRVPQRFWLGYGPDTMRLAQLEPFSRYDEVKAKMVYASIDAAHNEYLNILFHQGAPALAAYLTALAGAWTHVFRRAKRSIGAAMLGTAVLCYSVQALFGISQPLTAPYAWIALGLLESCVINPPKASENMVLSKKSREAENFA